MSRPYSSSAASRERRPRVMSAAAATRCSRSGSERSKYSRARLASRPPCPAMAAAASSMAVFSPESSTPARFTPSISRPNRPLARVTRKLGSGSCPSAPQAGYVMVSVSAGRETQLYISVYSRHSSASPASSARPASASARRSSPVNTPSSRSGAGRRSSEAPRTMRCFMCRRRILSMSPAVTMSSETGMTPTLYCESVSRYSRAKAAASSSMSPSTVEHCSSASTAASQMRAYSAAACLRPERSSSSARSARRRASCSVSKSPASA